MKKYTDGNKDANDKFLTGVENRLLYGTPKEPVKVNAKFTTGTIEDGKIIDERDFIQEYPLTLEEVFEKSSSETGWSNKVYTPEEEKYYKDFMTLKGRQLSKSTSYGNLVMKIMTDIEFALRHKFDVIRNWKEEKNEKSI